MIPISSYNISDIYWSPVNFNVIGDQFSLKKTPVTFDNGMSFNIFDFLNNVQDVSFNNKNGIILTNLNKNSNILKDSNLPNNINNLTLIESPLATTTDNATYRIVNNVLKAVSDSNYTLNDKLIFNFIDDNTVTIQNNFGLFLTSDIDNTLTFKTRITPIDQSQKFNCLLGDNHIVLFAGDTNYSLIFTENGSRQLVLTTLSNSTIPQTSIFKLASYINPERDYNSTSDSFIVKYDANPLINQKSLIIKDKDKDYYQNYLGVFPNENVSIDNHNNANYDFYFHGLKNYQTTEYDYNNNKLNRIYNKIYSGSNQTKGLDKIHLGYQTSAIKIEFPSNSITKFYFSPTSDIIPLSSSNLIEDGAIAGEFPYTSDRIFTSVKTNFRDIENIDILPTTDNHNKFLCSWLSNKNNNIVWYDRYYNSAYYTTNEALTSSGMTYNDKDPSLPFVYDIPSSTVFVPGTLYEYYHVGKQDSKNFLSDLDSRYVDGKYSHSNILSITNWLSSPILDDSTYGNNALAYEQNPLNFKGNYWHLDGTNHAIFPAKTTLLENEKLTTSIWLNVNDWANLDGYQIFGNYYDSGFGMICESRMFAPIISVSNAATGKLYNFNYRFGNVSTITAITTGFNMIQRMSNLGYWLFDSVHKIAAKYTVDDKLLLTTKITGISKIDQLTLDGNENFYIYDNSTKTYLVMDQNANFISSGLLESNANRLEISLADVNGRYNIIPIYGNASVIDNYNNIWEVIGTNLYKNREVYAIVGETNQMVCDNNNNIWILGSDDSYTKINSDGSIALKTSFSKSVLDNPNNCPPPPATVPPLLKKLNEDLPLLSSNNQKYILESRKRDQLLVTEILRSRSIPPTPPTKRIRTMGLINVPSNTLSTCYDKLSSNQIEDRIIIIDSTDNEAYLIDENGTPISKLNFFGLLDVNEQPAFFAYGDFTGHEYIRKYSKSHVSNNLSWKFSIASNLNGNDQRLLSLKYPISNLPKGWHNFTFTFDGPNGVAKYYIDTVLVDTVSFPKNYQLFYNYRTSLLLGATTIKNNILNNILNIDNGYKFIGDVGDLKMYNITLSQNDIKQLYYSSDFSPEITTLKWNMKVGKRNYIEEISNWFQFQLPTNKSKYFNINLHNLDVNGEVKTNIELAIRSIIDKLSPANTSLYKINWK
jgi:hypothetical protein